MRQRVLITGANGFIGKNVCVRLGELAAFDVSRFVRGDPPELLSEKIAQADAVIHLAGENRPKDEAAFDAVNNGLTRQLCNTLQVEWSEHGRVVPAIFTSSSQVRLDNPYGASKRRAEQAFRELVAATGGGVSVFRLPGVFGKWCKPNYNSVVATFCHNIPRGRPVRIDNPNAPLLLAYIDDVVTAIIDALENPVNGFQLREVAPVYETSVGALSRQIHAFADGRVALSIERVGAGFLRALYATYVSALPRDQFAYQIREHRDPRGVFVEMLKTTDSGQFSFLTAAPGQTRGRHYHHTKTEKFLVISGRARFRFRHLVTNERVEIFTDGANSKIVQTIPGWVHDITNVGEDDLIVMLWANEVFDPAHPDTVAGET